MKKRTITTILAAAMTCLVFAGCGSSKAADTASKEADSPKSVEVTATAEVTPTETAPAEAAPAEVTPELPEGEVDVVLDEGIDKYEGSWFEEIAGRGSMEISPSGDGKYYVEVSWSSSAAEMSVWNFTAILDGASGDLVYDDGSYQSLLFDENGGETVTEEKSVSGVIHLVEENKLEWTDNAFGVTEPSVFVR